MVSAVLLSPVVEVSLHKLPAEEWRRVWLMYLDFEPKGQFQGLPPTTPEGVRAWLQALADQHAEQFVITVGERVAGHSVLCRNERGDEAELAIFLHQKYRGHGLGRQLLLCTLHYACKTLGFSRVWLDVQGSNPRAQHLFAAVGFRPVPGAHPLAMELQLERSMHCEHCRGKACTVFTHSLPVTLKLT